MALPGMGGAVEVGVAISTSTTEVASCSPTSTPFSPHFSCLSMISCLPDAAQDDAPGSRDGAHHSRCRSGLSALPLRAPVPPSRASQLGHLFPYIPLQPGYNKRLRALAARSVCSSASRQVSPRSASSSACSIPPPSRALNPGRRSSAPSWPATPPTATAPLTPVTSGASGSTSSAPPRMPLSFCLAPANEPEREVALALLERARNEGCSRAGAHHRRQKVRQPRVRTQPSRPSPPPSSAPTAAT